MEINRTNYEAYLLDLAEGRLSAGEERILLEFLQLNPDCHPGFDPAELVSLSADKIAFPQKALLKKVLPRSSTRLTASNFDLFSIARMEGDLTPEQIGEHERFLTAHSALRDTWEDWQQTRLVSRSVPFPDKRMLKHRPALIRRIPWVGVLTAAAAITLILVLLNRPQEPTVKVFSENEVQLPVIKEPPVIVPVSPLEVKRTLAASGDTPLPGSSGTEIQPSPDPDAMEPAPLSGAPDPAGSIQPGSLRNMRFAHIDPVPLNKGTYDRIRPLEIPPTPVHQSAASLSRLAEMGLQDWVSGVAEEKDFSLWTIADAGIRGINRITGADMDLVASRDEEGGISGFRFKSKILNISAPLERSE
jgi:hypothetical protein